MTFVAGCIASLHPIYTEGDVIFVPGLLGTQIYEEDSEKPCKEPEEFWRFSKHIGRSYRLVYTDNRDTKGTFVAYPVILLTLSAKELRAFLPKHVKTKEAFSDPAVLVKLLGDRVT